MSELMKELRRLIKAENAAIEQERDPERRGYRKGFRDACRYALEALEELDAV